MSAATLPQLFQAVRELENAITEQRSLLIVTGKPTADLCAMAEKLSNLKKQIGALTVGKIFTA